MSKSVLWKSKCFSGLETALGENRSLIVIYEAKVNLLISVGKYYIYGIEGSLNGPVSPICGFVVLWGGRGGLVESEGGVFLPVTLRDR